METKMLAMAALVLRMFVIQASSQEIRPPDLVPVGSSEKHQQIVRDAAVLRAKNDYGAAIAKCQEVLSENPDDVNALYELGLSYFGQADYKSSLQTAYRGIRYKSENLSRFYLLLGNSLEQLNDRPRAIAVYKTGLGLLPSDSRLHYNLAMAYLSLGKLDEAKRSFKDAIVADPNDPNGHFQLSELYYNMAYETPTLLATCRFLALEPDSARSQTALRRIGLVMHRYAGKRMVGGGVGFDLHPSADEGDFTAADMALSIIGGRGAPAQHGDKIDASSIIEELKMMFQVLSQMKTEKTNSGFAWDYYRTYFVEIKKGHYEEAFCYYISQSSKSGDTKRWLQGNAKKVEAFRSWSERYQWPKNQ